MHVATLVDRKKCRKLYFQQESTGEKRKSADNEEVNGRIKRMHISSTGEGSSTVDNSRAGMAPGKDDDPSDALFTAVEGNLDTKTECDGAYCEVVVKFAEIRVRYSSAVATKPYGRSICHRLEPSTTQA